MDNNSDLASSTPPSGKSIWRRFLSLPSTRLGWISVALMATFVVEMTFIAISINVNFLPLLSDSRWLDITNFFDFISMLCGLCGGIVALVALIQRHERSWLVWLSVLFALIAIFLLFLLLLFSVGFSPY
jgi:hypothetical protein